MWIFDRNVSYGAIKEPYIPPPGNVTSIFPFPIKRIKGKICYILDPYSERLLDLL